MAEAEKPGELNIEVPWFIREGLDHQEFSAGGIRTFAVIEGKREDVPVIFLHGLSATSEQWLPVIKVLARKRLAIAPDLPGYGRSRSQFSNAPLLTPQRAREWMLGLLTAQGIQRFDLVADGFGAWIALEMLASDPARVRRLSLIGLRLWKSKVSIGIKDRLRSLFSRKVDLEKLFAERFAEYGRALSEYQGATMLIWYNDDVEAPESRTGELLKVLSSPETYRLHAGDEVEHLHQFLEN